MISRLKILKTTKSGGGGERKKRKLLSKEKLKIMKGKKEQGVKMNGSRPSSFSKRLAKGQGLRSLRLKMGVTPGLLYINVQLPSMVKPLKEESWSYKISLKCVDRPRPCAQAGQSGGPWSKAVLLK